MRKREITKKVFNTIWVGALGILFLIPLLWMLSASIKQGHEIFALDFQWIPDEIQWSNYTRVWTHDEVPFWLLYLNSLWVAIAGTAGQLLISSLIAYAFAKIDFKGKNALFIIFLITVMIPPQALIIPRYMLFVEIDLYGNHWALILQHWFNVTAIFLLRQFYMGLPTELMEAARIDGASHLGIWWKVYLPLTKAPMVAVVVLGFINAWNEYLNPLIFLPAYEKFTVPLGVQWFLQLSDEYNLMMAAASSAIVPVIILFLFTQKYFVEGIATTGVKG